jgi:surfactin synthase thioesterase subunit
VEPWFWCPRRVPSRQIRLFCFPYAGASASAYRTWPERLPAGVEVWAAQLPGRGPRLRERPLTRPEPLLAALEAALAPHLGEPFALFGHSMGALIAFELCRRLRGRGRPLPAHLFVSGRAPPNHDRSSAPVRSLSDAQLIARLRRYGGTPAPVLENEELLELLLPAIRADFELLDAWRHVPEPPLAVPLTVLGGTDDPLTPPESLEGWREQTSGEWALHSVPGGHFFVHTEEAAVLRVISQRLEGARGAA